MTDNIYELAIELGYSEEEAEDFEEAPLVFYEEHPEAE